MATASVCTVGTLFAPTGHHLRCSCSTSRPSLYLVSSFSSSVSASASAMRRKRYAVFARCSDGSSSQCSSEEEVEEEEEVKDVGVRVALSLLVFYKTQISPFLPRSCRYVPTCSEYSMQAYKKYGFFKGSVLTVWRICRCNPFGGYGFDPPRWFGEGRKEPPSNL